MTNIKSQHRVDTNMSEKMDYSIVETETWELIRLKQVQRESCSDEYNWYQHRCKYVL